MHLKPNFDLSKELREQSEKDWQFGALSQPGLVSIPSAERENYLPKGETQFNQVTDFQDCASRSPVNHLEALFTYHYLHGMKPENKQWMEQRGYYKDGKVTFSDRYIANLSGTTKQGNSLKAPVDTIRTKGLIPKSLLPKTETMTWEEYYAPVTQPLKDLGQEFLKRFTINYEQVNLNHFADVLKDDCIGTAGYAWPIPVNGVYPKASGAFNHAFLIYRLPQWQVYDNYAEYNPESGVMEGNDFTKTLAENYLFFDYGYRVYVSEEKVVDPLNSLPTEQSKPLWKWLYEMLLWILGGSKPPMPEIPKEILPEKPIPTPPNNILNTFCKEIERHEGWILNPPSRSVRNKNPGNCRYSSVGYLPIYEPVGKDKDNFAIFKDYETGFLYLKNLVKSKIQKHPTWDFYDFFAVYAPDFENDSKHYAEVVAKACDVAPTKILSGLIAQL